MGLFRRDPPTQVDEDDAVVLPERTRITLRCPSQSVDLWNVARHIEARMRQYGRPESTPTRPKVGLKRPTEYTWWWPGDEEEALLLSADDIVSSRYAGHRIRVEVMVTGGGRKFLPPPDPLAQDEPRRRARRGTFAEVEEEFDEVMEDLQSELEAMQADDEDEDE